MQLAVIGRKILVLDDLGNMIDHTLAKDLTPRTLDRLAQLCESELADRDSETWKEKP